MTVTHPTNSISTALLSGLAGVVFAWLVFWLWFVVDDAFILFRYAQNLSEGLGLRYNLGVTPPVEGYSELLWVLYLTIVASLGGDPTFWSPVASAISGGALIVATHRLLVRHGVRSKCWAVLFLAAMPPLALWSSGGLATAPFALVIFLVFDRLVGVERPRVVTAAVCAATCALLRVDGVVLAGLAIATSVLGTKSNEQRARLWRAAAITAGVLGLVVILHAGWRLGYHGDLLPHTARIKVSLGLDTVSRGLRYVGSFLLAFPAAGLIPLVAPWVPALRRNPLAIRSMAMVIGVWVYAAAAGGDWMPMGRFLIPTLPFVAILLALQLDWLVARSRLGMGAACLATLAAIATVVPPVFDAHLVPLSIRETLHFRWNTDEFRSEYEQRERQLDVVARKTLAGRALHHVAEPGDSIVASVIGALGYYSRVFVYDQNGLVTHVSFENNSVRELQSPGHDRHLPRLYFAAQSPTIWMVSVEYSEDAERKTARQFASLRYEPKVYPLPTERGFEENTALVVWRLVSE